MKEEENAVIYGELFGEKLGAVTGREERGRSGNSWSRGKKDRPRLSSRLSWRTGPRLTRGEPKKALFRAATKPEKKKVPGRELQTSMRGAIQRLGRRGK